MRLGLDYIVGRVALTIGLDFSEGQIIGRVFLRVRVRVRVRVKLHPKLDYS